VAGFPYETVENPWYELPPQKPQDMRDARRAYSESPSPAAYSTGALSDSIAITHLLKDRLDIVERLVPAYMGHSARIWARHARVSTG